MLLFASSSGKFRNRNNSVINILCSIVLYSHSLQNETGSIGMAFYIVFVSLSFYLVYIRKLVSLR